MSEYPCAMCGEPSLLVTPPDEEWSVCPRCSDEMERLRGARPNELVEPDGWTEIGSCYANLITGQVMDLPPAEEKGDG